MEYGPSISGGAGTRAMELAQGMARAGHEVTVVSSTLGESRVERQERLTVHLLSIAGGEALSAQGSVVESLLAWNDQLFARARRLFDDGEPLPDLVQCSNWISFPAARRLARDLGFPVLACVEYLSEPVERWWGQQPDPAMVEQEMRMCAEADLLLTVSDSMREILRHTYGVSAERIRVVYNGLDPAGFEGPGGPDEGLSRLRRSLLGTADRLVLFAGRLNPMKGIVALLEAAARVLAERPAVRYIVVGEADSRSYGEVVRHLLAQHPALQSQVLFLGKVPRPQLALLYRAADLALVPSVFDPCPYAPLEAMAAGLPVVGTATGGIGEVVAHEETGLLVPLLPPGADGLRQVDVAALAAAQLRLLNDEAAGRRMGTAGRQRLAARYTRERMLDGTMAIFRDCVAARAACRYPAAALSTHQGGSPP
jgi:glycosyltransferase involved in cell wall biosynthesis